MKCTYDFCVPDVGPCSTLVQLHPAESFLTISALLFILCNFLSSIFCQSGDQQQHQCCSHGNYRALNGVDPSFHGNSNQCPSVCLLVAFILRPKSDKSNGEVQRDRKYFVQFERKNISLDANTNLQTTLPYFDQETAKDGRGPSGLCLNQMFNIRVCCTLGGGEETHTHTCLQANQYVLVIQLW